MKNDFRIIHGHKDCSENPSVKKEIYGGFNVLPKTKSNEFDKSIFQDSYSA